MALDAIEGAFVARTITKERFFCPMAGFDTTVFSDNVISLLLQFRFECGVHTHGDSSCSRIPLSLNGWERLGWYGLRFCVLEENGSIGAVNNT